MPLSPEERKRYSRQILLPEFGEQGQERLNAARLLLVGAGGLGSPAALYLAAMGIGTIGIIDDDRVAISNLQRQILFGERDAGSPKAPLAAERLRGINSATTVPTFAERLTRDNALRIMQEFDLVLDGSDNFATRYLVNDACLVLGVPLISASILRFEGQLAVLCSQGGACYRCLFPEPPDPMLAPSCAEAGVIGALAGVMGTMMAMEAVKIIAGIGQPLVNQLLIYDALEGTFRTVRVERDPNCASCSVPRENRRLADSYEIEACMTDALEMTWQEFEKRGIPLIDIREEWEFSQLPSNGTLIPLSSLMARLEELPEGTFGIVCASGSRSLMAASVLRSKGITGISIRGGLNALR